MPRDLTNWSGNLTYRADSVCYPTSVPEVQELVAKSNRVKALGTRHSFNSVADSPGGLLISLARLPPIITVNATARTVSVSAGITYGTLAAEVHAQGFALHNMGSLPHISVAGATATGTHGSGDRNGILSTAISAIEIVRSDGSLALIDRTNPHLEAIAVGLGAFGVITRLVLDVEPTYEVRQDVYRDAPWDSVLGAFDDVMGSAASVSLIGDFASPVIHEVIQKTRIRPKSADEERVPLTPETWHGGTWHDDADQPPGHSHTVRGGIPGPWFERLPHFRPDAAPSAGGDELQSEYFVHRRHAVDALHSLHFLADRISPHLHAAEIRTVASDNIWLSPAYQRDSVCIGFTWRQHVDAVKALLPVVEEVLAPYEPRPHWGKLFTMNEQTLAQRFPRLEEFDQLRKAYDPTDKFRLNY